ncbi:MAG TPA: archaellin/type IV pilin N-terminal domain-containing protein [Candidatus Methanoperedens sp.]
MKANRKCLKNNSGDVGVGTLIIFISMVLVAAVAAAVLIYTTGALQQKATKTSKEATQQISSNIIVDQVLGNRTDTGGAVNDSIQSLIIRIKPDVGTTSIDLRQVIITIMDKDYKYDLNYSSTGASGTRIFTASSVRDEDGSFNVSTPVLNSGDLAAITISPDSISPVTLPTRKTIWLSLNQELGQAVNLEITTPNSYGVYRFVQLYP